MPCKSCNSCYNNNWSHHDCGNRYEPWNDDNCSSIAQDYDQYQADYPQYPQYHPMMSQSAPPGPPYGPGYCYQNPVFSPYNNGAGRCGFCDDCMTGRPCRANNYWVHGTPQNPYGNPYNNMDPMGCYNGGPPCMGYGDMYNPRCQTPGYPPPPQCFRQPSCRGAAY